MITSPIQLLKPYQRAVFDDANRFICWIAGRQVGKSFTGAGRAVRKVLTQPKTDFLIASPSERQSYEAVLKCQDWAAPSTSPSAETMPIRKTRTDAWEAKMSDEDRTKLYVLCGHLSYNTAKLVAKKEMKLDLPGSSTFYRFLERMSAEDYGVKLSRASQVQREIGLMSAKAGIADLDLVSSFQTMGAEAALKGDFKAMAQLIMSACDIARKGQKQEELRIANEKLKLAQAKEQKATKVIGDKKLTDAERQAKLKEIFGL